MEVRAMTNLNGRSYAGLVFLACLATAIAATSQDFTVLINFNFTNGSSPQSTPAQGRSGNLYGTTVDGGAYSDGLLFRISSGGDFASVGLDGNNGAGPVGSLVLGTDGYFYGTATTGGIRTEGTVFRVSPDGTLETVYEFCLLLGCSDGAIPYTGLTLGSNGQVYGTTLVGGSGCDPRGCGTVFKITPTRHLMTLYRFSGANGSSPEGTLVLAADGSLYGTTENGGSEKCEGGCGTLFRISPSGELTTLHAFHGDDGAQPSGSIVLTADGSLYGGTKVGGDLSCNTPYGCGTVFKLAANGAFTTLHTFELTDGSSPGGGLKQATDGNLYGTTSFGGISNPVCSCGTVFMITPEGVLTTLHKFDGTDGWQPVAALEQATSGVFYGTAAAGGSDNQGTAFTLSTNLSPFAAFVRSTGKVGQTAQILGQGFKGTTGVSFNGALANFEVRSETFLTATVPSGATTGYVTVTTPTGVLTSNVPFRVIQ
jgi:uncharacterized repeat protein (TIGR03803 family)